MFFAAFSFRCLPLGVPLAGISTLVAMDAHLRSVAALLAIEGEEADDAAARLEEEGIMEPSDLGFLAQASRQRILDLFDGDESSLGLQVVLSAIQGCAGYTEAWTHSALTECRAQVRAASTPGPAPPKAPRLDTDMIQLASAVSRDGHATAAPPVSSNLLDRDVALMKAAVDKAWAFFKAKCQGSPRFVEIFSSDDGFGPTLEETLVVRDCIRDGSRSHKSVLQRLRGAERFLREVSERGWNPWQLTDLQQSAWIRRQRERGVSCPAHAASVLRWLASVCGFSLHSLRLAFKLRQGASALVRERAKKAISPSLEMVQGLAWQITGAPTLPLRCFAGLCVLAVENSCGFREANRVRNLVMTDDALMGESRAKNHDQWLPWAAVRKGICGRDWALEWLAELAAADLPREDFILNAASRSGAAWLSRIAEHPDANAMLRLLLTLPPHCLPASEASRYAFHGLKQLYPTCGIQLKAVGVLTDERGVERLGHWKKNSAMPDAYNSEECVAELHTRSVVANAVLDGWRPAARGSLPATPVFRTAAPGTPLPCTASSSKPTTLPCAVFTGAKRLVHVVETPPFTLCKTWRCGFENEINGIEYVEFGDIPEDMVWCRTCGKSFS